MNNKRVRTTDELEELLSEQLRFIESSSSSFDDGFEGEAKRLAVAIRVLVHDTRTSHSLLSQLSRKSVDFWDSLSADDPDNQVPFGGLVFTALGAKASKYVAMLDDVPRSTMTSFEKWWAGTAFRDNSGGVLSRRDLVLTAANQDGGAHVDPKLDEVYAGLSKDNAMGWISYDSKGERPIPGPERAAIRQIAHEVLKTLKPSYAKKPSYDAGAIFGGVVIKISPTSTEQKMPQIPKVGRNQPCPCGSGKKFKRCHGSPVLQ